MPRPFQFWLMLLISLVLSGCITVRVDEGRIFRPQAVAPNANNVIKNEPALRRMGWTLDHITIPADYGEVGVSTVRGPTTPNAPLFVICMGTAADRYHSTGNYLTRPVSGADILVFDYPGYNGGDGTPTVGDFEASARAVSDHLRKAYPGRKIVAWGHSLGGFVCADIAARTPEVGALVLETTAQNIEQVVDASIPGVLKPLLRPRIANSLKGYDIPALLDGYEGRILVLGAGRDDVLKVRLSRALHATLEANGHGVTYYEFPEAGHNGVARAEGFGRVRDGWFREAPK